MKLHRRTDQAGKATGRITLSIEQARSVANVVDKMHGGNASSTVTVVDPKRQDAASTERGLREAMARGLTARHPRFRKGPR